MTRDEARNEIRRQWRNLIPLMTSPAQKKVNGETSWVCPICGHGKSGDGLTFNPDGAEGALKCFGCGFSGDILDLYQRRTGADYNTALRMLSAELSISIEQPIQSGPDYTGYYARCSGKILQAAGYLEKRGISLKTAAAYNVGFDPAADPANNPGGKGTSFYPAPRLIIPCSPKCYVARATEDSKYKKLFPKSSGGIDLFNAGVLYREGVQRVYIVEGAIDALSVAEAGREALALNSAGNADKLLDMLKEKPSKALLIICLDNDTAGQKAADTLKAGLQQLNISFLTADICGQFKDPNEYLVNDKEGFKAALQAAEQAAETAAEPRPDNIFLYLENGYSADRSRYREGGRSTGFKQWDEVSNGLHTGLYMLAAPPGAGKTTFTWQLCENLAQAGAECLYFTLEQSKLDLLTKSIARRRKQQNPFTTITVQQIKDGSADVKAEVNQIAQDIGNRISVIEGNFSLSAKDICSYIEGYIARTKVTPVVFIDYLQALKPLDSSRSGNREAVEDTADMLSELKNRYGLTMFIISSISRANYRAALDLDALKESGRLEFSADAVYSLEFAAVYSRQFKDLFESDGDINKKKRLLEDEKAKNPRSMVMKVIKSRYCETGGKARFKYYSGHDLFVEDTSTEQEETVTEFKQRRK